MPYAEFVEIALYHDEHGFYSTGGRAGRRGDFITSPEVGPLFGLLVARALDAEWDRLDQPEVFTVIDFGAGPGTLARSINAGQPRCRDALQYVAIERSIAQRAQHPEWVLSLPEVSESVIGDGVVGVIIANELLDNLPFTPFSRREDGLYRHDIAIGEQDALEVVSDDVLDAEDVALFDGDIERGVLQRSASAWLQRRLEDLATGCVWVIDYARLSSAEVEVRTYAEHGRGGDPLDEIGTKDVTTDVDLSQLERAVRPADRIILQAEWLTSLGIHELVEEGKRIWEAGAASGSLEALRGRSRVREAEALLSSEGLGAFYFAEWRH